MLKGGNRRSGNGDRVLCQINGYRLQFGDLRISRNSSDLVDLDDNLLRINIQQQESIAGERLIKGGVVAPLACRHLKAGHIMSSKAGDKIWDLPLLTGESQSPGVPLIIVGMPRQDDIGNDAGFLKGFIKSCDYAGTARMASIAVRRVVKTEDKGTEPV